MKKLTLAGVSYNIHDIAGIPFLIPYRLSKFERPIRANIQKVIALLKKKGWYEYILMAEMVMIVMPSPRNEQFMLVCTSEKSAYRPVFFMDSGGLIKLGAQWNASQFVHEATHVFQHYYFSGQKRKDRRKCEEDACEEQIRFLGLCGCTSDIRRVQRRLKDPRGWWEYLDTGAKSKEEHYDAERYKHTNHIMNDLISHISF